MNGQWVDQYFGNRQGTVILNLDDLGDSYAGYAIFLDRDPNFPGRLTFVTSLMKESFKANRSQVFTFDQSTGAKITDGLNDSNLFPEFVSTNFQFSSANKNLSWDTQTDAFRVINFRQLESEWQSEYRSEQMSWDEFKTLVQSIDLDRNVFRGQSGSWRLRTAFHRRGRADLERFKARDLIALHRSLSGRTRHVYDLADDVSADSFIHLA